MKDALTFYASFDNTVDADFSKGEARLYTAPSYKEIAQAEAGIGNPEVSIVPDSGVFGSALKFNRKNTHAIFYRAKENIAYSDENWSGTVSFWLRLNPEEDLEPGYCDPVQVTDVAYNDAALWVDFTRENPRQFRLGVFGDLKAWNPEEIPPDENPAFQNRLVTVATHPFRRQEWTQVLITFSNLGAPEGGTATLYLNGESQGSTERIVEPFSWAIEEATIRLGINYVGLFDELALFGRALNEDEIRVLYQLDDRSRLLP